MKAYVNFNGSLSEPVSIDNGVKQEDIPAPTLFSRYLAVTRIHSVIVKLVSNSVSEHLVNFLISVDSTPNLKYSSLVRELLYADDADLVAHTEEDLQSIINTFSNACTAFGLTISLKKLVFTPAKGQAYIEPNIFVNGKVVDTFVYLGSTISRDGTLEH